MKEEKQKFLSETLREDLENLERYIEEFSFFLPLAICTVNPTEIIVDINQATKKLIGYNEVDIVGQEVSFLFKEKAVISKFFKKVLKEGLVKNKEVILVTKNKKEIPVSISASIRKDYNKNVIGYFLAISDITEIKKFQEHLEEKVEERTKELQGKIEELERFHKLAVGRELKMISLKEKIEELEKQIIKPAVK